jgi:two-component system sensor histidine kinase KdpD
MRLNKQVSNLLAVTKVEAPELTLAKEDCPVEEIIGAAISALEEQPYDGRIIVQLEDPSIEVSVDESLMQQAFINLLDNALKHTQSDSTIKVTVKTAGEEVIIAVSDNGPGISDRDKARIFDKFQRGESPRSEGSGLGLAICKGIVQAHGGRIWVEDEPKGGAVFKIALQRVTGKAFQVA